MISYEIENANKNNLTKFDIKDQLEHYQVIDKFPSNLKYVNSYTDPKTGTTATAFLSTYTDKVTVGMTRTNIHKTF